MIGFIIWLFFLLICINECYKGNYLYIIFFMIVNVLFIYIVIKEMKNKKSENKPNIETNNGNKDTTDEDIQDLIFFDMIDKK